MEYFWNSVVAPALEALQPARIIEIGCEKGATTRRLIDWISTRNGSLHGIDPAPQFDAAALAREADGRFVFHRALSLDALHEIDAADVVFVDGDHNWFTVINELRLLERKADEAARPFPLTFLHDIGWPYGRRDLYHAPGTIPPAWRHPHSTAGLRYGCPELVPGGINAGMEHARIEGGRRNGVLTAVEDFLSETKATLDFLVIPGLFGLGILADRRLLAESPPLDAALAAWRMPDNLRAHVDQVEEWRLRTLSYRARGEVPARLLIVSATDMDAESFSSLAPLGMSLERLAGDQRIQSQIVVNYTAAGSGLPSIYNRFLTREFANHIVLFTHDDVHLDDWFLVDRLQEALRQFDIVGVAGNRAPDYSQPSWALTWDAEGRSHWQAAGGLSGCVNHIVGESTKLSRYGPTPSPVELIDGCFIAVNVGAVLAADVRFDECFRFHFYDLDFCRTCRSRGLRIGTWPIAITHASGGDYGSSEWLAEKDVYFAKWGATRAD